MNNYKFEIEKEVPAVGTSNLSDKAGMQSLLDSRLLALEELAAIVNAERDFLMMEIKAARLLKETYAKL